MFNVWLKLLIISVSNLAHFQEQNIGFQSFNYKNFLEKKC